MTEIPSFRNQVKLKHVGIQTHQSIVANGKCTSFAYHLATLHQMIGLTLVVRNIPSSAIN